MRPLLTLCSLASLTLLVACSTPESRISAGQAAFNRYPAEIQQKIRAGQVAVGFNYEMVQMALGKPDRTFVRKTEAGDIEVWGYRDHTPQFSFGVGVGSSSGGHHSGTAVGGGVGMSTGNYDPEEKVRVEFHAGLVTAVELLK